MPRLGWAGVVGWAPAFARLVVASSRAVEAVLEQWDARLLELGGDPAREDWSTFRPLRLSREEDWSDWLGHLLERSRSGRFSARLLGGSVADSRHWAVLRAEREVSAEGYRADLVVHFDGGEWAHVEVKVGDLSLAKTTETGAALRRRISGRPRGDYLLLPEEDVPAWEADRRDLGDAGARVRVLTWRDVARALRYEVQDRGAESVSWRVWALTYAGAVEQMLLGFAPVPHPAGTASAPPSATDLARLEFLTSLEETS